MGVCLGLGLGLRGASHCDSLQSALCLELFFFNRSGYHCTYVRNAPLQVVLFVKPLEDGQVILRGVTVEVLSLVTTCRVDKWGRGTSLG